jgi:hypothetical protein
MPACQTDQPPSSLSHSSPPAESTRPHNGSGEESHPKWAKLTASATEDKQEDTSNEDSNCPYGHAKDGPVIRLTFPHFDIIPSILDRNRARPPRAQTRTINSLSSSNNNTERRTPPRSRRSLTPEHRIYCSARRTTTFSPRLSIPCQKPPPFATLKAANGTQLNAIGRKLLRLTPDIELQAYIFANAHLTANLLGLAPLCDHHCTAMFMPTVFQITQHQDQPPILTGQRLTKDKLWMVTLSNGAKTEHAQRGTSGKGNGGTYIAANSVRGTDAESYIKFIHASFGFPAPTTFLKAVTRGYITGPNQFPRLTPKMVRRYMPNAIATARDHLDKTNAAQPHDLSEAVSARKRHHLRALTAKRKATDKNQGKHAPFSYAAVPKSTTLHLDYTGPLPEPCASGTRYFMVSCWRRYIHLEPLTTLRAAQTTRALTRAITFWRNHNVTLKSIRMDNEKCAKLTKTAITLKLKLGHFTPYAHQANRVERAIRTSKNHIIAARAGFHPDCPTIYLDKCPPQIEMTLNILHPYEYDPTILAYQGIYRDSHNFNTHPIAPVGTLVLTWDSPNRHGTWVDHGI